MFSGLKNQYLKCFLLRSLEVLGIIWVLTVLFCNSVYLGGREIERERGLRLLVYLSDGWNSLD